ncbi:MAG TPA: SusC/RagA family TonB-linked outer membrane protein [Cyclobacteriaceae bacterium]|nr:SusC/RagA family TonB-linked outer membrane protein [Cyclobacteriaceae bacterium]
MKIKFTAKGESPGLTCNLLLCFLLLVGIAVNQHPAYGQQRSITGTVLGEDDFPIPGASVLIKGTSKGTVTDLDGVFKLNLEPGEEVLVITYIGYDRVEMPVGNNTALTVRMAGEVQLTEVVITAAGIERDANTLGYAVSTVSAEDLAQKSEPDPIRALTGKIAGVNIQSGGGVAGGATTITIRGNSSLGNNNQPLYVVDGVPFDNSTFDPIEGNNQTQSAQSTASRAYDIDPNNIESLTVLKGAAASALYGSRAANGAIIITTKSAAKKGRKGMEINYSTSYSVEEVSGLPDYQQKYGQGTNGDYRHGVYGSYGSPYSSRATIPHPLTSGYSSAVFPEFYEADGVTPVQVPYESFAGKSQRDFFRTGHVYENSLSINSGHDKGSFTIGGARTQNEGVVPGNTVTRTSVNVGGNATLDNGFYTSGSLNYVKTDQETPPIGGTGSVMGNLLFLPSSYDLTNYPFEHPITGDNIYYRALDNPYWSVKNSPSSSSVDRYYGNFTLGADPTSWLNIQNTIGFNAFTDKRVNVLGKGSSQYANGTINTDDIYRQELDNTLLLTFTKDINSDISFKGILGNNVNQRRTRRSAFSGDGIIVKGIHDIRNTTTITLANIPKNQAMLMQRFYAFFTDLTFGYKDFASLNFVGRNDVSSTLPADNRSYLYGGVNGSIIFTKALKMSSAALNYGTIRAGYTKVGNEASPYQTVNVYNANSSFGDLGSPFSNANNANVSTQTLSDILTNSGLKPEFITEFELGTEMRFFQDLISLDVTYYDKRSTSQIFVVNSAPSSGYLTRIINLGETSNKGVEVGLNATPIMTHYGLTWDISANFTKNVNKVEDLGSFAELTYGRNVHIAGQPYGQIYGSRYARDDEGNILVNPQTSKPIVASSYGPIGDPNPDFMVGISNNFRYKGLSLDVLVDWKQGGDILSTTIGEVFARGLLRETEDREAHLMGPGVLGDVNTMLPLLDERGQKIPNNTALNYNDYFFGSGFGPSGGSAGYIDEGAVFDATVIRLREISLGYSFPKQLLNKTPFGSASLSISGRNLWYLAPNTPKGMNYDPELSTSGANNMGFDILGVPSTRRYGVNLRVSF